MNQKKAFFEYYLYLFSKWYCQYKNIPIDSFNSNNNLSKLKVIKLHFFACSTSTATLNFFNRFYALPYGHVESDVYREIGNLLNFDVYSSNLFIKDPSSLDVIFNDVAESVIGKEIRDSVVKLSEYNPHIINFSPFDLVELSHRWFSWQYAFKLAKEERKFSHEIAPEIIMNETKFYSL